VPRTDLNTVWYRKGDYSSDAPTSLTNWSSADFNNANLTALSPVQLDFDTTADVNYLFLYKGDLNDQAAVVLKGSQDFTVYTDSGTAKVTFSDTNGRAYYLPNYNDFREAFEFGFDDDTYFASNFIYTSLNANKVNMYMQSDESASAWDSEKLFDLSNSIVQGPEFDANMGTFKISEDKEDLTTILTGDGSSVTKSGSTFVITVPEEIAELEAYLGSSNVSSTPVGGKDYAGVAAGETKGNVTVTAVNCGGSGASAVEVVPVSNLVKTAKGSGKSIIVGGWVANAAAANLEVSAGNTLEKLLINSGDYVAAVLASGDIVVAGFSGNDTGRAAQDLISALEGLM
ncbi:MAG TPA: hypothetical protein PKK60_02245, partial [archaeon]|nr:hypothetical protein [archaeon]